MGRRLKWIAWMLTILLLCTAGAAAAGGADTGQTNPAIPESFDEESLLDLARKFSSAFGAHAETGEEASEPVQTLENALAVLAEKSTDPWQKAILLSGPETVSEDEEGLTFFLSPYDPGLAEIRDLSEDPAAFLQAVSGNAMTHSLEIRAVLEGDSFTAKSGKAILTTTKKAAAAAKKAFSDKAVLNAVISVYFPRPEESVRTAEDLAEATITPPANGVLDGFDERSLAILFYGSVKFTLDTSKGPDQLVLNVTGAAPEKILEGAGDAVVARYAKISYSNRTPREEILEEYLIELAGRCLKLRKNGKEKTGIPLRADDLAGSGFGDEYFGYLSRFEFLEGLDAVAEEVGRLPDLAALDLPANGILTGGRSGTKVIVKAPADGKARYVQIRRSWDDRIAATLFIRSGKSVSFKAPQGEHYLLIASGFTWYGEDALFGVDTSLSRTNDFDIPSAKYKVTIPLIPVANGNLGLRGADPSMFHK